MIAPKEKGSDFPSVVDNFAPALRRFQDLTGVNSEKLLRIVGTEIGAELAKAMTGNDLEELLAELGDIMRSTDLGILKIKDSEPLVFQVERCLGCSQIPDALEKSNCALREGVLKAVFDERLGVNSDVKLTESVGSEYGAKTCTFRVLLKKKEGED